MIFKENLIFIVSTIKPGQSTLIRRVAIKLLTLTSIMPMTFNIFRLFGQMYNNSLPNQPWKVYRHPLAVAFTALLLKVRMYFALQVIFFLYCRPRNLWFVLFSLNWSAGPHLSTFLWQRLLMMSGTVILCTI